MVLGAGNLRVLVEHELRPADRPVRAAFAVNRLSRSRLGT